MCSSSSSSPRRPASPSRWPVSVAPSESPPRSAPLARSCMAPPPGAPGGGGGGGAGAGAGVLHLLELAHGLPLVGELMDIAADKGPNLESVTASEHQHPGITDPKHRAIMLSHARFAQDARYCVLRRFDFSSDR